MPFGHGLAALGEVSVVPVGRAGRQVTDGADLVVAGEPTHVHGMTRESTRKAAVTAADRPERVLRPYPADGERQRMREEGGRRVEASP